MLNLAHMVLLEYVVMLFLSLVAPRKIYNDTHVGMDYKRGVSGMRGLRNEASLLVYITVDSENNVSEFLRVCGLLRCLEGYEPPHILATSYHSRGFYGF